MMVGVADGKEGNGREDNISVARLLAKGYECGRVGGLIEAALMLVKSRDDHKLFSQKAVLQRAVKMLEKHASALHEAMQNE